MLYAESSAVLAWLQNEDSADEVASALREAESVMVSELTLLEVERVLTRAELVDLRRPTLLRAAREQLRRSAEHWVLREIRPPIWTRAAGRFPVEPIRALDALHLAFVLDARAVVPDLAVLSLDVRVRENAAELGFDVLP